MKKLSTTSAIHTTATDWCSFHSTKQRSLNNFISFISSSCLSGDASAMFHPSRWAEEKTFGESRGLCALLQVGREDTESDFVSQLLRDMSANQIMRKKNFQKENYTKALTQRHWTFAGVFDRGPFECVSLPNAFATTHFIVSPLECFPFYFELRVDGVVFLSCVCAEKKRLSLKTLE